LPTSRASPCQHQAPREGSLVSRARAERDAPGGAGRGLDLAVQRSLFAGIFRRALAAGEAQGHLAIVSEPAKRRVLPAWRVLHLVVHRTIVVRDGLRVARCVPCAVCRAPRAVRVQRQARSSDARTLPGLEQQDAHQDTRPEGGGGRTFRVEAWRRVKGVVTEKQRQPAKRMQEGTGAGVSCTRQARTRAQEGTGSEQRAAAGRRDRSSCNCRASANMPPRADSTSSAEDLHQPGKSRARARLQRSCSRVVMPADSTSPRQLLHTLPGRAAWGHGDVARERQQHARLGGRGRPRAVA